MALQEAGGRGISSTNMPMLNDRCQVSGSSSNTPARNAAFDTVLLANIVIFVNAFFFLPGVKDNSSGFFSSF